MNDDRYRSAVFNCSAGEREKLFATLRESLMARQDVLFAYVYGSFGEGLPFHDIDVGIYLAGERDRKGSWSDVELIALLEQAVSRAQTACQPESKKDTRWPRIPVDVRVLNRAPLSFSYHVLRGRLLFSRDEDVRVPWVARIVSRYLDLKPLRHAALKEAMISWA